jgi:hypothetical protein
LSSLGVVTHIIQGVDSTGQVIAGLRYTGIRNIRDDATHDPAMFRNLCNVHASAGAMVDELPIVDADPYNIQDSLTEYESLAACGAMLAAEGPNEPNNFNFKYNGNLCSLSTSFAPCAQYQRDLYKAIKNDPKLGQKPVWSLTEPGSEPDNQGLQYLTIPSRAGILQPPTCTTTYAAMVRTRSRITKPGLQSPMGLLKDLGTDWMASSLIKPGICAFQPQCT